jgi:hypothetical protein
MIEYEYQQGMSFLPDLGGGRCFPQAYCLSLEPSKDENRVEFTDDIIFAPAKKGLFQLVVLLDRVDQVRTAADALHDVEKLSQGTVITSEATFAVHDTGAAVESSFALPPGSGKVVRVATASEFALDERICGGRPAPLYYDEYRMKKEAKGMSFVILRQDRFIFAACADKAQLDIAACRIDDLLCGKC